MEHTNDNVLSNGKIVEGGILPWLCPSQGIHRCIRVGEDPRSLGVVEIFTTGDVGDCPPMVGHPRRSRQGCLLRLVLHTALIHIEVGWSLHGLHGLHEVPVGRGRDARELARRIPVGKRGRGFLRGSLIFHRTVAGAVGHG